MFPEFAFFLFSLVAFAIVVVLFIASYDGPRIEKHIHEMGCELVVKEWAPKLAIEEEKASLKKRFAELEGHSPS